MSSSAEADPAVAVEVIEQRLDAVERRLDDLDGLIEVVTAIRADVQAIATQLKGGDR